MYLLSLMIHIVVCLWRCFIFTVIKFFLSPKMLLMPSCLWLMCHLLTHLFCRFQGWYCTYEAVRRDTSVASPRRKVAEYSFPSFELWISIVLVWYFNKISSSHLSITWLSIILLLQIENPQINLDVASCQFKLCEFFLEEKKFVHEQRLFAITVLLNIWKPDQKKKKN